jgi:hypothetical protein
MPKTDPLGTFVAITGDMAKLMRDAETELESASRPPKEAREIVLLLCDNPALKQQLDQGIEEKLHEWGVTEVGNRLVAHAQVQEKALPPAIYRPYQKAISDYLEEINYAGPGAAVPVNPVAAAPAPPTPAAIGTGDGAATAVAPPAAAPALPPPAAPSSSVQSIRERLANLKGLYEEGLITEDDFNTRRAAILAEV